MRRKPAIVGMTLLLMDVISDGWIGFIEEVAVLEDFQRMGIAQALLDWSLQVARAHHCVYVDLTSSPKREAARHLYTSVGFVERKTGSYRLNLL